jgi:hypothetical protein
LPEAFFQLRFRRRIVRHRVGVAILRS